MTPAARLQATIEILDGLAASQMPADRFVRDYFRQRRYAGSKDRASVAERVFQVFRHRSSFAWRMRSEASRALVIASVLAEGAEDVDALFNGAQHGPAPLSDAERAAFALAPEGEPPQHVRGEFPGFLESELAERFGDDLLAEMQALQARAPIDLRVNTLNASRDEVLAGLRDAGYIASPAPCSPFGIRLSPGATGLDRTSLFESGAFEFQDEASQIAALLCDAEPGMDVLDIAAGGGGKSLALAATMENRGRILAFDDYPARLKPLHARAARAGASIIAIAEKRGGPAWGAFDRVLVDAPCSGTGTWRRQPELRWRLTPERLETLMKAQDGLLDDGARHTAPGGRLIYVTCSLLPCENDRRIAAFLARNPGFAAMSAATIWAQRLGTVPPPGLGEFFHASPYRAEMDGFFAAVLARGE